MRWYCVLFGGMLLASACGQEERVSTPSGRGQPESGEPAPMRFEDLPRPVQAELLSHFGDERPAEADEAFNHSDVIASDESGKVLPSRRVLFAAVREGRYFVFYEHGGATLHRHLVGLSADGDQATASTNLTVRTEDASPDGVRHALAAFAFESATEY